MKNRLAIVVTLMAALVAVPAAAQTLYKLIDKNGKVTYVDKPPKDFDGKVIPVEIDTKRNSATISTPGTPQAARAYDEKAAASDQAAVRLKAAEERLDAARKALEFARENPAENEVERMGNVGGHTRPVPTPEYEKRLASLEDAVKSAEEEVKQAQRAR
jgi:exonuclease VII small subunit